MECSSSKDVCSKCLPGFWLIEGCCTECYDGFHKNSDGTCVRCTDSSCKECDSSGVCTECRPSYFLKTVDGVKSCSLCTETGYGKKVNANNIAECTACISGCSRCVWNIGSDTWTCAECANSKFVEFCSKTYCIDCTDVTTQIQIGKYCYESNDCVSNCKLCASATTCATCDSGYYVSASKQCLPCGTDCLTCSDLIGSCTKCSGQKYIFGGVCVSTCVTANGFYLASGWIKKILKKYIY